MWRVFFQFFFAFFLINGGLALRLPKSSGPARRASSEVKTPVIIGKWAIHCNMCGPRFINCSCLLRFTFNCFSFACCGISKRIFGLSVLQLQLSVRPAMFVTIGWSRSVSLMVYVDTNGHLPRLGVKFHPRSGSNVKFPTPGEREGVKCPWYARRGMLGIQKWSVHYWNGWFRRRTAAVLQSNFTPELGSERQ